MSRSSSPGTEPITLQVSLAPPDLRLARETLPHQLRCWARQVDEVLFTVDLGQRRRGPAWSRVRTELGQFLDEICAREAKATALEVDYSAATAAEVSERFFGGRAVPLRDFYGKVVYPYFFGLHAARHRYVLHVDADMIFGGASDTWTVEARRLLDERDDVFSCSPLPGPPGDAPMPRHVAVGHAGSARRRALASNGVAVSNPLLAGPALRFARMSTRTFLLDRTAFDSGLVEARPDRPGPRACLAAVAKGALTQRNPWYAPAETSLTAAMRRRGMVRIDFLGSAPGMWSLHPPHRTEPFYRALPEVIRRVEAGEIPTGQRGDYDLNGSLLAAALGGGQAGG
jgi:hypothetical protein